MLEINQKWQNAKEAAAKAALDYIEDGMKVGLGSGSTAEIFIHLLGRKWSGNKFPLEVLATSERSRKIAASYNLPLLNDQLTTYLDIVVDGADQIDPKKDLVKGLGGALLREKIVANISKKMVVIADESKQVEQFNSGLLPIELLPFAYLGVIDILKQNGIEGSIRKKKQTASSKRGNKKEGFYLTDQGNYILDIDLAAIAYTPQGVDELVHEVPGVLESGFFFDYADVVIIGYEDSTVKII